MESNHVSWAPPKAVHTQDTDPEWDADLQAPKANPWETMCSIFISILCIFGGEKSEYDNEFVVSTTRAVSTSAPCQHMGSCYPWRVINPTNPSNVFVLGLSLLWKCSLNCAKGSAQTLLAQAWLCPGRAQGRRAHPACPLCPCHCSGHTEQDSFLSLHQHAAWGAARKEQNSNQKGGDGAEPMEVGCTSPALPQLRQGLCSEPEPETRTFPNPGVFDLPAFWFSCGCLLCVTVHYFRNGCRLSKGAVGKFRLMGNLLAQTKSQSSHKTLQTFSQLCYITRESEQLWIISQLSFLSFYSSATVAPFFPIRRNLINILYPY